MRKKFLIFLVILLTLQISGCASSTFAKKFIRKKSKPDYTPSMVYTDQGPYQKQYSNEYYYKTHFTMFKASLEDAVDSAVGGNGKRLRRALEETHSHLDQMSHYLKPQKAAELAPAMEAVQKNLALLRRTSMSSSREVEMKMDLERLMRLVSSNFYYDKVKEDVLPDDVTLGE